MPPQRRHNTRRDPTSAPPPSQAHLPSSATPFGPRFPAATGAASSSTTTSRGAGSVSEQAMTPEKSNRASASRGTRHSSSLGFSHKNATASTSSSAMLETFESAEAASEGLLEACNAAGGLAMVKQAKSKWTITCGRNAGTCPWSAAAYKVSRGSVKPAGLPGRWWCEVINDLHSHADATALPASPAGESPVLDLDTEMAAALSPLRLTPPDPLPPAFYPQLPPPPPSHAGSAPQPGPRPSPATWPNTVRPLDVWRRWKGKAGEPGAGSKRTHDRASRRQRQADGEAASVS